MLSCQHAQTQPAIERALLLHCRPVAAPLHVDHLDTAVAALPAVEGGGAVIGGDAPPAGVNGDGREASDPASSSSSAEAVDGGADASLVPLELVRLTQFLRQGDHLSTFGLFLEAADEGRAAALQCHSTEFCWGEGAASPAAGTSDRSSIDEGPGHANGRSNSSSVSADTFPPHLDASEVTTQIDGASPRAKNGPTPAAADHYMHGVRALREALDR
jgi:hypothetical protein